ncbi:MAG: hypothetical protein IPM79_34315 [Polyangiaceae bacterium]|nr:hypothetical protein [Polyangiaceae bacterium]MBK8942536.1 hypothetical protein [Polyangiaceae bacterium]
MSPRWPWLIVPLMSIACAPGGADDATSGPGGQASPGGGGQGAGGAEGGLGGGGASANGGAELGGGGAGGSAPEPDFDDVPWQTGDDVGFGVASKDTESPLGESVFVGYAGYGIPLDAAQEWVEALYRARLRDLGVRYVFAVQGPADVGYTGFEIGNSKIAPAIVELLGPAPDQVIVAAHSSGSFVAHELLAQLAGGLDPAGVTDGRVTYFNLDGGSSGLSSASVERLEGAFFVAAYDSDVLTWSPNQPTMASLGATYASAGGYLELDVTGSGCLATAVWCLHMTVITSEPHNPAASSQATDYTDYDGRAVTSAYLDQLGF